MACNINTWYTHSRWPDVPSPCGVLGATCCHEAHRLSAGARPNAPQQPQSYRPVQAKCRTSHTARRLASYNCNAHPATAPPPLLLPATAPPAPHYTIRECHDVTAGMCERSEPQGSAAKDSYPQKPIFYLARSERAAGSGPGESYPQKQRFCLARQEGALRP
jgi:hypothetical protein